MREAKVTPTGVERTFDEDRLIVTKTDRKGIITYANAMFLEVSALTEREVLGQPHNVIRHPEMPRCVFQLLWERISHQKEIFAYVVNLAADGAHYWVLAHVTPSLDPAGSIVGYHSSRRLPQRKAVQEVQAVYAKLRAEEARHSRPADAVAASADLLRATLAERGQTYDQFVWALTEIAPVDEVVTRR
ncbi:PAS domain-containing protein [Actinoplanes sp. NPDC049802]|uniref:PAS domain-containing protein n=1 Tax=Actinoplanes sp. NPDC049802 TaxID=3154742 RepID=UPI0033CC26F4